MDWSDTYFLPHILKTRMILYTVFDKVKNMGRKNGGKIQKVSDKKIIGEKKGLLLELFFLATENAI